MFLSNIVHFHYTPDTGLVDQLRDLMLHASACSFVKKSHSLVPLNLIGTVSFQVECAGVAITPLVTFALTEKKAL